MCFHLYPDLSLHQSNISPFRPRFTGTVACPAAPTLATDAPIIDAPTGFEASRLPYSMAYDGTLIPSNTDDVVGV